MKFPIFKRDFLWGAGSSAFQVEGAWNEDEKGPSIWDVFNHKPGKIHNDYNADISSDFYHHYREDIKLMADLNLRAFALSISWPRIFPLGEGKVNKKGIEFYRNVLKELKEKDISTFVSLYHWDLPQSLQENGGWLNRETSKLFANYADLCFKEFGDLVDFWVTINEPQVVSFIGYYFGTFPPEIRNAENTLRVQHNLLFAHGLAVDRFRKYNFSSQIGIKIYRDFFKPFDPNNIHDLYAKRLADESLYYSFSDPIMFGNYPSSFYKTLSDLNIKNFIEKEDLKVISQKIDFLGLNYYTNQYIKFDNNSPISFNECWKRDLDVFLDKKLDKNMGSYPWEEYPEGIYYILLDISKRYKNIPIYITENGKYVIDSQDKINDFERINYLKKHIERCAKAVEKGANLKGYFVWSFLDSFEWIFGYTPRFGLIRVDFEDIIRTRTPKESAYWYSKLIKENT